MLNSVQNPKPRSKFWLLVLFVALLFVVGFAFFIFSTKDNSSNSLKSSVFEYPTLLGSDDIPINITPKVLAYNSKNGNAYAIDSSGRIVSVIGSGGTSQNVGLDFNANSIATDSSSNSTAISGSSGSNGNVVVLDGFRIVKKLVTPSPVTSVTYGGSSGTIYAVQQAEINGIAQSEVVEINTSSGEIIANISINGTASGIVYNPDNGDLYVSASSNLSVNGIVTVIDTISAEVVANLEVGVSPTDLIYDSANGGIYVSNSLSSSVSVINSTTNEVVDTIPVQVNPGSLAYDSSNGELYVADMNTSLVSVINTTSNTFDGTIDLGVPAVAVAFDTADDEILVATVNAGASNATQGAIVVISGDELMPVVEETITNSANTTVSLEISEVIPIGGSPTAVAIAANGEAYIADNDSGTVTVVNLSTGQVVDEINVGIHPIAIVYDSNNSEIYVVDQGSNDVEVISTENHSVIAIIEVGSQPSSITYDPENQELYVADFGSNEVTVINTSTNTVDITIELQGSPTQIAYDPVNGEVYVAESSGLVEIINATTNEVVDEIQIGANPTAITVDTRNGEVFIAAESSGQNVDVEGHIVEEIYVINATTNEIEAEIVLADNAVVTSLTYDSVTDEIIAAQPSIGEIEVIEASTNTISDVAIISANVTSVTYDSQSNEVIATSSISDEVIEIQVSGLV